MPGSQLNNSFSWGDALFLYIERPGQPLSIACVSIFEGSFTAKMCRELMQSKLPQIPRYRQRVVFPPFNIGLPTWEFDPKFDIRNHIREVKLHDGSEADLKTLMSGIISTHLDRYRPLWDLTIVRGLSGNRTGMIARIHHCLADGLAGLSILNVLMDQSPTAAPTRRTKLKIEQQEPRDPGAQLLDNLVKSYSSAVKGALMLHGEALSIAQQMLSGTGDAVGTLMDVVPEIASPAERLPFNVVCHGPQKFGWTEISMDAIKQLRQRCGGTVNDVILTVVGSALRRYSELRGVKVKGRSARIMIPVNVRGNGDLGELGNRIYFLPITVPLDLRDPQKLFGFVRERMEFLKRVRAAELVGFAGGLFSTIPPAIWAAIGPVASQLPLSLCNIICTNVPGPQTPVYMLGHKMIAWYPYVPIGGEMGVNCAILSYNGNAYFGFSCDVGAVPDPENLEKFVKQSFAELYASSNRQKSAPKSERRQKEKLSRTRPKNTSKVPVAAKPKRTRNMQIPLGKPAVTEPAPAQKEEPKALAVGA